MNCEYCGKYTEDRKFCNRSCGVAASNKRRRQIPDYPRTCQQCGIQYFNTTKLTSKKWEERLYCSRVCANIARNDTIPEDDDNLLTCWYCDEYIEWARDIGNKKRRRAKFCSREHFRAFLRLPNGQQRIRASKFKDTRNQKKNKIKNGLVAEWYSRRS